MFSPWAYQNPIFPNYGDYRRENKVALLLVAFGQIYQSINVQDVLDLLAIYIFFWVGAHMFLFSSFFVCLENDFGLISYAFIYLFSFY